MQHLIMAFGLFILVSAGLLIVRPATFTAFMLKNADQTWLHVTAVVVRLALGIALLLYAPSSNFPLTLNVLGWIALVAGIVLALIPPLKFKRMIHWSFDRFGKITRVAGVLAVLFGAFLIYAVA